MLELGLCNFGIWSGTEGDVGSFFAEDLFLGGLDDEGEDFFRVFRSGLTYWTMACC